MFHCGALLLIALHLLCAIRALRPVPCWFTIILSSVVSNSRWVGFLRGFLILLWQQCEVQVNMRTLAPEEQAMIVQLQDAARVMQTPAIPRGQMQHAEEIFKNFRRMEKPYALCKQILENNVDQVLLYQAACALKDALVREWRFIEESERVGLRDYLFRYIIMRTEQEALVYAVRERLVQVIAVMVKRECIDDTGEKKSAFLKNLYDQISRGEPSVKLVGASLICSILQEFAVMTKSSDFGLPFADHFKAKRMFEMQDLLEMFRYILTVLKELEHMPPPYSEYQEGMYDLFLLAAESILSWTFVSLFCIPRRIQSAYESDANVPFRPPPVWKNDVLKPEVLQLFFNIYCRVNPSYPELRQHAVTCLYQLASFNRFLSSDEEPTKAFLQFFIQGWMFLTANATALTSTEALGLTNIVRRLTLFFSPAFFMRLPKELRTAFFDRLSTVTQVMALKACEEDAAGDEESKFSDALEYTLQTWLGILLDPGSLPLEDLAEFCCPAFDAFVLCHLGPPQGKRLMRDEEEITEVEDADRDKYKEQLSAVGVMGRAYPAHVLPLLVNCFEERLPVLQNFVCAGGDSSSVPPVTTQMTSLFEDLHWLLLISGSVLLLSMDDSGLDTHVPMEIMEYSTKRAKSNDPPTEFPVSFQAKFRGLRVAESPCMISESDPLVRLFCDTLALIEILCNAEMRGRGCILSPELMSSTYWFLERFVKAYLVLSENSYSGEISLSLLRAFGMDTDAARWVMNFLFESACSSLNIWTSEEGVLLCVTSMLKALGRDRRKGRIMSEMPAFWTLVGMQSNEQFRRLPSKCVRAMMHFFVLCASHTGDKASNEEGIKKCLWYPLEQFEVLVREDLSKMEGNEVARSHILFILDLLTGAAEAGLMATSELIFTLALPALKFCSERILVVFNNDVPTVDAVLELMNAVAIALVCYLSKPATEELFKISLATIGNYAKFNVGKRTRQTVTADNDDAYNDILLIIEILSNILSRDYLDLSPEVLMGVSHAPTPTVTAAQVSLEGLNLLMPLMTHDLLSCPPLCKAFYRLLAFISVISPETFTHLTADRQGMFYNVVVTGLTAFDSEVTKNCLDITSVLALQVFDDPASPLRGMMSGFVKVILELSLGESLRSDNITAIGTCLFSLMCAYPDVFQQQVDAITAKLRAESLERAARLEAGFKMLVQDVRPVNGNAGRARFIANFEKFAIEAQAVFLTM